MPLKFSLFIVILVFSFLQVDGGHHSHHHVIIHIPYKIHTIHHTIMKHIHHHDQENADKYEVIGYSVGKPVDLGHFDSNHKQRNQEQDSSRNNELDQGQDWTDIDNQFDFGSGGHGDDRFQNVKSYAETDINHTLMSLNGFNSYQTKHL